MRRRCHKGQEGVVFAFCGRSTREAFIGITPCAQYSRACINYLRNREAYLFTTAVHYTIFRAWDTNAVLQRARLRIATLIN